MGFFAKMGKKMADKAIKKTTKNMAPKLAAMVSGIITAITTVITMLPIILIVSVIVVAVTAFDWLIETITAKANSNELYSTFELKEKEDDMTKMIQIKKNSDGEYYLDFVDDIDEKIEKYIEKTNNQSGYHNVPEDVEFFKKIIQAEVCMKFPNLGGKVPEDSTGFQGVVDVRRVSPDKEIGDMKNTGQGKKKEIEEEEIDDPIEVSQYEEIVKTWEANKKLKLINSAAVYKERESEIKKGEGTGVFDVQYKEGTEKKLIIIKESEVTYTGKYKSITNPLTKEITVYVEIKYEDIEGYVKASNLISIQSGEDTSDIENGQSEGDITRVASNNKITSRAKDKTIGKPDKKYTVAIAAGHNNTDKPGTERNGLKEEELTIKVAEKVEEILNDYSNIKVVQTGSTSSNRGGIKNEDRNRLAREANPDLCIQIHFNAGGGTGSEVIYKQGDGISQELAEVLSKTISNAMGIKNRGDGSDKEKCGGSLGIIENSATSGFPSVVTEGAFLDGDPDLDIIKNQNGIQKYAQGIVEGIDKYFQSDHKGYSSTNKNEENVTESVKSVVKNLQYKPLEEFKTLVSSGSKEALNYFTLDEDNKLITATWSFNGGTAIEENPPVDLTTVLQQYIVPFEYLLFFYMDTNYQDFSEALADKILKSEVVIVVKDNVTTTKEVITTQTKTEASDSSYSTEWSNSGSTTTINEEVSTSVDVTYIDTWCVKIYNENSYSAESLGMGKKDKVTINIDGTVTETNSSNMSDSRVTGSGTGATGAKDEEGNDITYSYTNYQRDKTNIDEISNEYESGKTKTEGKEKTFVKLYQKHEMHKKVRTEGYLFTIIEQNEKTANLLNLTKYLIFKSTGIDDGVVEYDFGEFELSDFKSIEEVQNSGEGLKLFLKWMHTYEGGTKTPDGKFYIVESDGSATGSAVGHGVDIGTHGATIRKAGYSTEIGSKIPVDFVDALEEKEVKSKTSFIKSQTKGLNLTEYQMYALISRAYNCGNAGAVTTRNGLNFKEAYNKYWKQDRDDKYGKKAQVDYNHNLYSKYMSSPTTSQGNYLRGLELRRKSEWLLFQTGYFDRGVEAYCQQSSSGDFAGGDFLETAKKCWVEVCTSGKYTSYGASSTGIPAKGPSIDCSGFVSWVLYEYGYKDFKGWQKSSSVFYTTNWNKKYGWEEIPVGSGQKPKVKLQPGDIFVRYGEGTHHVLIVESMRNGKLYAYDCGNLRNWKGRSGAAIDRSYFLDYRGSGKIIRVTKPK